MPDGVILAIDQGTTNTKAMLVDRGGSPVFRTSRPIPLVSLANGFVEQDPELIWQSVIAVMAESAQFASASGVKIEAVAISNQRETALAWDAETGQAAAPAIGWQCGRGAAICSRLAENAGELRARTGLPLAPLISATKWAWLLENDAAIRRLACNHRLRLGTVDSWLIHKFTQGEVHATDLTNGSRTGLLNLSTLAWDRELLELFGIAAEAMPEPRSSSGFFGKCATLPEFARIPILAAIGDSHAAMLGHGSYAAGTVKATYGTGSSLMALTPALALDMPELARTIAWSIGGEVQFALEGNIAMTGSAIQWLGEFLALPNPAADVAALAASLADADGVYFVPAMVGLGAPYWDAGARGAILGLSRSHTSAHLARAAFESIAFQVADVFFAMERAAGRQFAELRADGGATRNAALMQVQADVLGRPVVRSLNEELSALGAAWLAGLSLGWWTLDELEALPRTFDIFAPKLDQAKCGRLYRGWRHAVDLARQREEPHA